MFGIKQRKVQSDRYKGWLSNVLWTKVKLKWKIVGPVYDIKDERGNITESGVFDTNKRTVALVFREIPIIKVKIT